jgi:Actin like proteins N terminal domain
MTHLIAIDVGNAMTKFRRDGGPWDLEPSLVRTPDRLGYSFTTEHSAPRTLSYLEGPATMVPAPYLIGQDALRFGTNDQSIIGSAEMRARSDAYVLLHLFAILASLPTNHMSATVALAGGLPVEDYVNRNVGDILKSRLKGLHILRWGDHEYRITIEKILLVPQPIGALATLLFSPDGKIKTNGDLLRQRFVLDIGGGTCDYTGRRGLDLIPGTEGGISLGVMSAAERAVNLIRTRLSRLRSLTATQVLEQMQAKTSTVFVSGDPVDIQIEIEEGMRQVAGEIVRHIARPWGPHLEQGEVLVFGGGGELMAGSIGNAFGSMTRVTLPPNAIFRVADGIERLAKNKLVP